MTISTELSSVPRLGMPARACRKRPRRSLRSARSPTSHCCSPWYSSSQAPLQARRDAFTSLHGGRSLPSLLWAYISSSRGCERMRGTPIFWRRRASRRFSPFCSSVVSGGLWTASSSRLGCCPQRPSLASSVAWAHSFLCWALCTRPRASRAALTTTIARCSCSASRSCTSDCWSCLPSSGHGSMFLSCPRVAGQFREHGRWTWRAWPTT
mmetsp:Transcript_566/g.1659  ORF Transcript_566/g.1659 Transcript_566/m.1659 type:complete len:210 (+) Transcript_566:189-818(+)